MRCIHALPRKIAALWRSRQGNIAIIFGLSLIPIAIAAGAGLDVARAMIVRQRLAEALDAAALAAGSSSKSGMTVAQLDIMAQSYFNANYVADPSFGTPRPISADIDLNNKVATISTSVTMPTVLIRIADLIGCTTCDTMTIPVSTKVVWGMTKLWVSLVLDNTGSMAETDKTGTSKISALKTGASQLLTILQNAATAPGDIQAAIIPFSKDVNLGASNNGATWIDWSDWEAAPPNSLPSSSVGPGSPCPYSTNAKGYTCQTTSVNGSTTTNTIPLSGLICPSQDNGNVNTGRKGHYYNGCYNSTKQVSGCTTSCLYNHSWVPNLHSTWGGCVEDRQQSFDVQNTSPGNGSNFPSENALSCPPATVMALNYNWSNLNNEVNSMVAKGSTNQTIGLAWGWQAQTPGAPLSPPTLSKDTMQFIIILSDGLNTQDRWYGDGANHSTSVDSRMNLVCSNAKAAGYIVYSIFVDLNGTQGNSAPLQNCASDSSKYFDLTTSGDIITTLNNIAQDIISLRVSQ